MKAKFCSQCGSNLSEEAVFCPHCGATIGGGDQEALASAKPMSKVIGLWVFVLLVGVSLVMVVTMRGLNHVSSNQDGDLESASGGGFSTNVVEQEGNERRVERVEVPADSAPHHATIVRKRLEPEATKRLSTNPQTIKSVLTTTGRGENAKWGLKGMFSFMLTYVVVCDAEIVKKEENAIGEVKIVEKRIYKSARQDLQLSDLDVALSLSDTLPMNAMSTIVDGTCALLGAVGWSGAASVVKGGAEALLSSLNRIDGKSVRGLLGKVGIDPTAKMEKEINAFVEKTVKNYFKTSELEGKSYLITYYQDKDTGAPLRVDFTYADGSKVKTADEWLVLRRANVFIDSKIVPDRSCSPGDSWKVDSADFDCLLDPYVEGSYSGEIEIERQDDDPNGNWLLSVKPGTISILSDRGRGTGEVRIEHGEALVDGDMAFVKIMSVRGRGAMKNLSKHHLLFQSRFEGECEFRATMTTEARGE